MSTRTHQLRAPAERLAVRAALSRLRRVTGVPVAFGGGAGPREMRLSEFSGTVTDALTGLRIVSGTGLGGKVLATGRADAVADYVAARGITHEYDRPVAAEGLRAILAVPVVVCGEVGAVLYGGLRAPLTVGAKVLDAALTVANGLGVELSARLEVERRLAEAEAAAAARAAGQRPEARAWEDVRAAHAELRSIACGVADPALRARLQEVCDRLAGSSPAPGPAARLSPRELDVLAQVAMGCTNAETARRLGLLHETVKSYLRSAMRKLGTHTRTETVAAARRTGLLP